MKPFLAVVVLSASFLSIGLSAQRAPQTPRTLKRIFVTVVDQGGAPVLDLGSDAFTVTEAGMPREVSRASLVREPMRIALIVDTSQQSAAYLTHIRAGLHAFLDALPLQDEVLVMGAGGQARVRIAPTLDRQKLNTTVGSLFAEGGAVVLLDALRESWTRFLRDAKDRWPVFVVVGTSGPDNSGIRSPEFQAFTRELQSAAANVHAIMLMTAQSPGNIASYTGGHYESLAASSALPGRMKLLAEKIAAHQQRMSTTYEVDFFGQSADPQAQIGVFVAREGAGILLSLGRPIE